jgi:uncharacterized membrane protein YhaH (DUF805 family)
LLPQLPFFGDGAKSVAPETRQASKEFEMEWYLMVWKKFAQFDGRARRKEYWMFVLLNMIICLPLYIIGLIFRDSVLGLVLLGLYLIYVLASFIPSLAVGVRRLHDTNKSGWFMLLGFIPLIGLVLLVFLCIAGDAGPNQYGPDPKAYELPA